MNGSPIDAVTLGNLTLGLCLAVSIASAFLKHDCELRGRKFLAKSSDAMYVLMLVLVGAHSSVINDGVFHFSGVMGLGTAIVLSALIFCIGPNLITERLCKHYFPKPASKAQVG